jgi:ribosomal protein S18 acetylase RimI-like enzyme
MDSLRGTFQIRAAEPRDLDGAYDVCLKTGDDGQDATALYEDPEALGRIFVGPYFVLEPGLAFVLEDDSGICGYVLGASDSRKFHQDYLVKWAPDLQRKYPAPTGDPAGWNRTERIYYDYHHPEAYCPEPYALYPSHLHIDLLPRAQGRGWGRQMIEHLLEALRVQGSQGVHLGVGQVNERAIGFYRRLGFAELARHRDVLYLGRRLK